ncbi:MAG: hypothetical protein PHV93_02805 [Candidatus Pacebacteria bacterium]|nr:hypothetical protein [Candidatus Paceibacterota bacterium]
MRIFRFINVQAKWVIVGIHFVGDQIIEELIVVKDGFDRSRGDNCLGDRLLAAREVTSGGLVDLSSLVKVPKALRYRKALELLNKVARMIHNFPHLLAGCLRKNPLRYESADNCVARKRRHRRHVGRITSPAYATC